MSEETQRAAQSMLKDSDNYPFISNIIKALGIGRTIFYRYFPPERIVELRS